MKKINVLSIVVIAYMICVCITAYAVKTQDFSMYSKPYNWAVIDNNNENAKADVFFINPTVYLGSENSLCWSVFDDKTKTSFVGAINMEKGIYDDIANFYSPYYHQAALSAYYVSDEISKPIFDRAYSEVEEAFEYYLNHYNNGRPFILAGFSQGAYMAIRLVEQYSGNAFFDDNFIACYAIGWRFTDADQANYPNVKFAAGETDTGVIIAFNSEAENIDDTLLIPNGMKTMAINPLSWTTDNTIAEKEMNLGACFTNYSGEIKTEIPFFTGAYIDDVRGALKVTDVNSDDYPGVLFENGVFHLYDYQFFYRNLEKNVQDRIEAFLAS